MDKDDATVLLSKGPNGYSIRIMAHPKTGNIGTILVVDHTVADAKMKALRILLKSAMEVSELVAQDAIKEP